MPERFFVCICVLINLHGLEASGQQVNMCMSTSIHTGLVSLAVRYNNENKNC